jgi:hypothetical protein
VIVGPNVTVEYVPAAKGPRHSPPFGTGQPPGVADEAAGDGRVGIEGAADATGDMAIELAVDGAIDVAAGDSLDVTGPLLHPASNRAATTRPAGTIEA